MFGDLGIGVRCVLSIRTDLTSSFSSPKLDGGVKTTI